MSAELTTVFKYEVLVKFKHLNFKLKSAVNGLLADMILTSVW